MRSITISILLVFAAQAYAKNPATEYTLQDGMDQMPKAQDGMDQISDKMADDLINKLVDRLIARVLNVGTVGSLAIPQRGSLRTPTHIAHAASAGQPIKSLFDPSNSWNPFVMKKSKSKDSYADWAAQYRSLVSNGLQPLTALEAEEMVQDKGAVFVDVRPEWTFNKFQIEDSINVPLFQKVQGNSMKDAVKRGLTSALAVDATERNPNFAAMAKERLPRDKPIIIACDRGGILDTTYEDQAKVETSAMVKLVNSWTTPLMPHSGTKDFDRYPNRYTLSLKAAYELYQAGFTNLYFLEGGMRKWEEEGLPLVAGKDSE